MSQTTKSWPKSHSVSRALVMGKSSSTDVFIRAECDQVTELCVCLGAVRGSESSIGGAQQRSGETEGAEHTAAAALPDELHVKHTA